MPGGGRDEGVRCAVQGFGGCWPGRVSSHLKQCNNKRVRGRKILLEFLF